MNRNLWIGLGVGVAVLAALVGGVAAQSKTPPPPVGAPASVQAALGTAFTYQGQLKMSAGNPVNGNCNVQFGLWDSATGGAQLGITQTAPVSVTNGLFSATLNESNQFGGAAFNGEVRYLGIAVRCGNDAGYTALGRQPLTAAPYAHYATAAGSVPWSGVVGAPTTLYYPLLQAQSLDLAAVDSDMQLFAGGFTDGRYGYFVPDDGGKVARVDLQNFLPTGVITYGSLVLIPSWRESAPNQA